ncbi:biopolymer transport protein ExbB [Cribrihabitans marinus]|uniref:Biopolymer transport protein ExbB n=1 Tax=Cribrihabitans marinus TaxID=1227549 RepID=A0A1H7DYS4_9RHOB|nr:MotA/TolQ/ExbB proton channel family protein [Cribrihabitans marinus]SEK03455.1 biopolymer transport protein ExbB [Cribrihabitans marinus]
MAWFDTLGAGGPILAVLAVLSLISVALIVVKTLALWPVTGGGSARDAALAEWAEGRRDAARAGLGNAAADRVLAYAMQALSDGFRGAPLIAELTRRGNEEFAAMSRGIRVLELIAMISPLLGLLGTVTGMIQSFQELELAEGAANASVLAGGIWQALLTTAAGLLVAIPAAVAASLLAGRAERGAQAIENAVGRLMVIEEQGPR